MTELKCFRCAGCLFVIFVIAMMHSVAVAATITVNPGDLIADALAAAEPGDTIKIKKGTYTENLLLIDKANLTLQGAGHPVIDGDGEEGMQGESAGGKGGAIMSD